MKMWERYFFKEIVKVFTLFLFCFFITYVVLDYSSHTQDFAVKGAFKLDLFLRHYKDHFLKRFHLLSPLALLLATTKVLRTLNLHREWMALEVAGIKRSLLLRPFFLTAFFVTLLNYANFQYTLPSALDNLEEFENSHFKFSKHDLVDNHLHMLVLSDKSKLFYQSYDSQENKFANVIWVRNLNDLWYIKFLSGDRTSPIGQYADHIARNKEGQLTLAASYERISFEDLKWHSVLTKKQLSPYENRSIRALFRLYFDKSNNTPAKSTRILTELFFKCIAPFTSLLAVLAVAPFCIRFSRSSSSFRLYSAAFAGFVAYHIFLDTGVILGEFNILSPVLAIAVPFSLFVSALFWKFKRKIA